MAGHVRGSLFAEYVRMLRARKGVDWPERLPPEDLPYLAARIDPDGWYPMATFERFGLQILELVADGDLDAVRAWGHMTVRALASRQPDLLVEGDPRESVMRFHVLRQSLFDFAAATILRLHDGEARLQVAFGMSPAAEEAASHQTLGFFEGLLELAGAEDVQADFASRRWAGDASTTLQLCWRPPSRRG
jgi:hypothetical protein